MVSYSEQSSAIGTTVIIALLSFCSSSGIIVMSEFVFSAISGRTKRTFLVRVAVKAIIIIIILLL